MKLTDLRRCDFCSNPVAGNTRIGKAIDFHRVVVEHHILNAQAVNEHVGLSMMLGGNEALATIMGTGATREDATLPVFRRELMVCTGCWSERGFGALQDLGDKGRELEKPETERALARAERR